MRLYKKLLKVTLFILTILFIFLLITYSKDNNSTFNKKTTNTTIEKATPTISSPLNKSNKIETTDTINEAEAFNIENSTIVIEKSPYKELFTRNNDYIGWITINDTPIDLPILKGDDNEEYLRKDFDYNYDQRGSIFMDYRNFGFGYSKNTILYGHNLNDDSMFGDLKNYSDSTYGLNHTTIEITDLYKTRTYQVFSSYFEKADSNLITVDFNTTSFETYLSTISQLSVVDYDLIPSVNDHLLTLVTCSYELDNGRFFVHAIEIINE